MDRAFRRRLVFASTAVVIVIALSATTALLALRSTQHQFHQAQQLDRRLAVIDQLRRNMGAMTLSARRYMLSGDGKEHQRVLAIAGEMATARARLAARSSVANGNVLETELDQYIAWLTAMQLDDSDPITRLSRFEDELVRVRTPLAATFDEVISRERSRRDATRSTQSLARAAQWGVVISSILGVLLAIGTIIAVLRRFRSAPGEPHPTQSSSMQRETTTEPAVLR